MPSRAMKPSERLRRLGLGDLTAAQTTGAALIAWLQANGCTQNSVSQVSAFQSAYNSSGLPGSLTVDGQYGGNTQSALQNVLNASMTGVVSGASPAPDNCFAGTQWATVPATPAPDAVGTSTDPTTNQTVDVGQGQTDWAPWIIGGAAALGAGIVGYAFWKGHHMRGRR